MKSSEEYITVCASCTRIRSAGGVWFHNTDMLKRFSHNRISHSICRECAERLYPELYEHTAEHL